MHARLSGPRPARLRATPQAQGRPCLLHFLCARPADMMPLAVSWASHMAGRDCLCPQVDRPSRFAGHENVNTMPRPPLLRCPRVPGRWGMGLMVSDIGTLFPQPLRSRSSSTTCCIADSRAVAGSALSLRIESTADSGCVRVALYRPQGPDGLLSDLRMRSIPLPFGDFRHGLAAKFPEVQVVKLDIECGSGFLKPHRGRDIQGLVQCPGPRQGKGPLAGKQPAA